MRVTLPSFHFSRQLMGIMLLQHCCLKNIKPAFAELFLPLCFIYTRVLSLLVHDCSRKRDSTLRNETTVHALRNRKGNPTSVSTIEQRKRKIGNNFLVHAWFLRSRITCTITVISGFSVLRVVLLTRIYKEKAFAWRDKDIHY